MKLDTSRDSGQTGDLRHDAEAFYSGITHMTHYSINSVRLEYEPLEVLGSGISSVVRRCLNRINGSEYAGKI